VNSTSVSNFETETCSVNIPFDFYVTGINLRNPKKAAKLKPTDFSVNFLLCCSFAYLTQQSDGLPTGLPSDAFFSFVLMSRKLNNRTRRGLRGMQGMNPPTRPKEVLT